MKDLAITILLAFTSISSIIFWKFFFEIEHKEDDLINKIFGDDKDEKN